MNYFSRMLRSAALAAVVAATVPGGAIPKQVAPAPGLRVDSLTLAHRVFAAKLAAAGHVVVRDTSPTRLAWSFRAQDWAGGPVVTDTGETVNFYISTSFSNAGDPENQKAWASFFSWLYHGSELSSAYIFQAPAAEVVALCGNPNVLGCSGTSSGQQVIIFPGDQGVGVDMEVGAHEYGHHIARNRSNDPWPAVDWGTKGWASAEGICARTVQGTAFPGDEGDHYTLNPGEGFAESYRLLNVQRGEQAWANMPWNSDPTFYPSSTALGALLADVQQPWAGPQPATWSGQVSSATQQDWTQQTPLDGSLQATVQGTANATIEVLDPTSGAVLAAPSTSVSFTICGQRSLLLRVLPTQAGSFQVSVTSPSLLVPPVAPPSATAPKTPPAVAKRKTAIKLLGPATIRPNARGTLHGRVYGGNGGTVVLQYHDSRGWHPFAKPTIRVDGSFSWTGKYSASGCRAVWVNRAFYAGDSTHYSSFSNVVTTHARC